jgi:peptide/nickel transport system permease protein
VIAYLVRRVLQALAVLVLVSLLGYGFLWLLPGAARQGVLAGSATGAGGHGVGQGGSGAAGYLSWLAQLLRGNLGYSYVENTSVGSLLAASLPRTLALTGTATVLAAAAAIPAGMMQAVRRGTSADRVLRGLTYLGYGVPSFLLGSILILIFAVRLRWFGAEGPQAAGIAGVLTDWRDLTLPVLTLAVLAFAVFARYVRSAALDSLGHDYVRTARSVGAGQFQVLSRHVLRNSLAPVITLAGLSLPRILGGALVVESLFNIQGMGWQLWQAAQKHDYAVLLAFILVIGAGAVIGSLLADVGYVVADPRVRYARP